MIDDLIDYIEITEISELDLSDKQLCLIGIHLINHLRSDHEIPGKIYYQLLGICDWFKEHHDLTDKQRIWMLHNLKKYIDQRDFFY